MYLIYTNTHKLVKMFNENPSSKIIKELKMRKKKIAAN